MSDYLDMKCVLLGDGKTGKSTFIKRQLTGQYQRDYLPTDNVDLSTLKFHTNQGTISFKVWDTAGQEELRGLRDIYYMQARCAIIMFDVTRPKTFLNVTEWRRELIRICPDIPIVLCGNKADFMLPLSIESTFHLHNLPYYPMSVKTGYNYDKPFLWLARRVTDNPKLRFVKQPVNFSPQ
ncbi:uncharacterized protein Dwil_GK15426 [Drosophila willistoni]|uniref:GTP-binding nuclear protein n=1 Tax=Drosophila willistoni TaxID=7260 RepID=B4MV40_DROWI|nr:GTP-binding nuclear protein Ran [Drosophila willistoni]EDW76385.1 uncharacterized protein Dwil_GK15426 [Drosophila willistoni]